MACPHAAGALALVVQAYPGISVVDAQNRLQGAGLIHASAGRTCGGLPEGTLPNHHVGHGRINVNGAI